MFRIYHQEMLVNMNFQQVKTFYLIKNYHDQVLNIVYKLDKKEGDEIIRKEGKMMKKKQQLKNIINQI